MHYLFVIIALVTLLYVPQVWVKRVLARYNQNDEPNFQGTGGELARHLLDRFGLPHVAVEITDVGDHYDPDSQTVRLTKDKYDGQTLTAITVAAHECGHAFQHADKEALFMWRMRLARWSIFAQRLGSFLLFIAPFAILITRAPSVAVINIAGALLVMGFSVFVQLITLPVELDASFKKALPILAEGYLSEAQLPHARKILKAAAWTYVAASLGSLLNIWRWLAVFRR